MSYTPKRIVLISRGRREEYTAGSANIYPGHLLKRVSGSARTVDIHATPGGPVVGGFAVAEEDALQGGTINGVYDQSAGTYSGYASGYPVFVREAAKGDMLLMRLTAGQNVAEGTPLMSNGDGTLTAWFGPTLYQIVAPSTTVTNVNTETAFSNGSYAVPANFLAVGDQIRITGRVFCIAENSTNTHQVKLYIGTGPITLLDATALQLAANDVVEFDITLTIRTVGATGTFVGAGTLRYTVSGTSTLKAVSITSQTLDTTAAETIVCKVTPSAASAGNQIRLDDFAVACNRNGGLNSLATADEAIDNSGGTTPFIRVIVN